MKKMRTGKHTERRVFILIVILSFLLFLSSGAGEAEGENLLYNGDFELLDEEGLPEGWFTDAYRMDPGYTVYSVSEGTDGSDSHAVSIHNTAMNDARFAQDVPVEPNTLYCLSGYIRADEITGGHGANLSIEGVYAFSEKTFDTEGTWKYIEYYGETGPDQHILTVFARVGGYSGESKGTAAFDNLSLTKADTLPDGVYADLWFTESTDAEPYGDQEESSGSSGNSSPAWPVLIVISLLYVLIVISFLYWTGDGKKRTLEENNPGRFRYAPFLFLALGIRIIISWFSEGYSVDVNCFVSWGYTMAHAGPAGFYLQTSFCDYPPLYTYILGFNSWLSGILNADAGWNRVIFRFIPCFCDVAGCWLLLHAPKNTFTRSEYYRLMTVLLAFNPVTILNSAAWGQMDSVLCFLLLCVAVFAMEGKWIPAIAMYVTAVLVKPQALMLGILGLLFMILAAVKDRNARKKILAGTGIGLVLIAVIVIPFGIRQEPGWLIRLYTDTLSSYPYATVNTANLYYIAGGNWSKIETAAHLAAPVFLASACAVYGILRYVHNRKDKYILAEMCSAFVFSLWFVCCAVLRLSWVFVGSGAMVYAFVIVSTMALRAKDIRFLPYLGALLFILLYVFGIKMHERYLFPAFMLLMCAWAVHRDRRILYLLLFFSVTVFINEGIVLDNSIRFGAERGHLNEDTVWLADILSILNIAGALYSVYLGSHLTKNHEPCDVRKLPHILPAKTIAEGRRSCDYHPDRKLHWTLRDTLILCAVTVSYTIVALTTLGSTKAPQTAWCSSGEDEQVVFDLGEHYDDVRILYFAQVSRNDFIVSASEDAETWNEEVFAQMDQGQCWKWKYVTQSFENGSGSRNYYNSMDYICHFSGRYIRITSRQVGLILNEIIFRDPDGNNVKAVISSRNGDNPDSELWSDPSNMLDEQDTLENLPGFFGMKQEGETQPSWWNSTYFDEIYHARTGFEFMNGTVPYETSHPPLGKVLISWCISIFGMTPFGWRFAGALAGILMLPGIYLLAKQLTKKTYLAAFACLLMALDCMHLTQTQIATIDSFPVLFIIFAYFFMLRFMQTDLSRSSMKTILLPLFFSGLNMGLAVASKWIGIYAGIGLALLYFWHCIRQIRISQKKDHENAEQPDMFRRVFRISLWCILFFVAVPLAVYLVSYIPYMAYNTRIKSISDYLAAVWRAQESMLNYHSTPGLGMDHPFYSPWWQWPIIGKPMYYATEQYILPGAALHHSIFCFGNPVIWWGGLAAILVAIYRYLAGKHYIIDGDDHRWHIDGKDFDIRYGFLFIGLLAQYLPWVLVPRGTYIYHYFASVPFLILITTICLDPGNDHRHRKVYAVIAWIYIVLALLLFIMLLPYVTGIAAPGWWLDIGKNILRIWY